MHQTGPRIALERELLSLEDQPDREFAHGACRLLGAQHLILLEPGGDGRLSLALATELPETVQEMARREAAAPSLHLGLFPAGGALHLSQGDLSDIPLAGCFPTARWCVVGVGPSSSFIALWFGEGEPDSGVLADPLLCKSLLRRLEDRSGAARRGGGTEAAAEALTRLSHEFKTPLVSIKGYAELLLDHDRGFLDPKMRQWVKRIAAGANRLASLFRKATAEARTAVADGYQMHTADPADWVQRCIGEAATLARGRQLEWSVGAGNDLPPVRLDREAAQDLLLELLQNAARATPDGGQVRVEVVAAPHDRRPGVRVTVEDSGIGVPRGAAGEGIFERFATLSPVLAHHSGDFEFGASGLGLGLSMARGVARAHGGEVWVEAMGRDPDRLPGTRVHVWLPVAAEPGHADSVLDESTGRLLILEPDPEARQILQEALEEQYQVVVGVASTEEALAAWAQGEWAGCILEPRTARGGSSLVTALRSRAGAEQTPIVTYSTGASAAETSAWRAAGADSCVEKPARTRVLLQRLSTIRSRKNRP